MHSKVIQANTYVCRCVCACVLSQFCPTLCDPMGCRQPGPSVRGISHARILVWISISFSATRSMMLGWRTTDAVTVGAHRWPAQRDLPLVVQEMFSLLACDFHNLLRSQEGIKLHLYIVTMTQHMGFNAFHPEATKPLILPSPSI